MKKSILKELRKIARSLPIVMEEIQLTKHVKWEYLTKEIKLQFWQHFQPDSKLNEKAKMSLPPDNRHFYPVRLSTTTQVNHFRKLKAVYKKDGEQGVRQYVAEVANRFLVKQRAKSAGVSA